ncbi:MAG: hypothetical protein GTN74_05490 [Proteobacteria bacterium]|nr:hypothetical protein [Pseudomonadota bacterium]NIS68950.1 hypothetical protein [Pseudomonadota bacterium]
MIFAEPDTGKFRHHTHVEAVKEALLKAAIERAVAEAVVDIDKDRKP